MYKTIKYKSVSAIIEVCIHSTTIKHQIYTGHNGAEELAVKETRKNKQNPVVLFNKQ